MYKLKVKKLNDEWVDLDLSNERPAMNYHVNDIAEMKDRQSDYSQEIKLPKTKHNKEVLDNCHLFENPSIYPYRQLECRLYADDMELAKKGSILVIESIDNENINCQILSGNIDFFSTMDNRKLAAIEDRSILGSIVIGKESQNTQDWVKFANCYTRADKEENWYMLNIYKVVEKLCKICGYSLVTNLTQTDKNAWMTLCSLQPMEDSLNDRKTTLKNGADSDKYEEMHVGRVYALKSVGFFGNGMQWSQTTANNGSTDITGTYINQFQKWSGQVKTWQKTSDITGVIKFEFKVKFTQNVTKGYNGHKRNGTFFAVLLKNGETIEYRQAITVTDNKVDIEFEKLLNVEEGDDLRVGLWFVGQSHMEYVLQYDTVEVKIQETECERLPIYSTLYFQNNLGFETYWDLFKAWVQTYGMTVYVDNSTKTVYSYTFKQLYDNKAKAKDWSGKLITGKEEEMNFTLNDYGQNNFIYFKEADDLQNRGEKAIDNTTLKKWSELFTIDWQSGKEYNGKALIPIYEYDNEEEKESFKGTETPHIVRIDEENNAVHIYPQELMDKYYKELFEKMLIKAKVLEIYLNLKSADITEFEPFVPIYLSKYGAYFYVSKIQNFINKELTKCELVRM